MHDLWCDRPRVEDDGDLGPHACGQDDAATVEQGRLGEGSSSKADTGGEERVVRLECEGVEGLPSWVV